MRILNKGFALMKKIFIFFTILIVLILGIVTFNYIREKISHLNVKSINISLYINCADEVSKEKLQINWKELAAIQAVKYKNDLSKVNDGEIKDLASMFLVKNNSTKKIGVSDYKLLTIDEVLIKLSFKDKEKDKVHKYLDELKDVKLRGNIKEDSSNKKFIDELTPAAIELYNKYNVLPSVTIGQAILESGWGKSDLSTKSNNLFGIKADSSWKGKKVTMKTSEHYNQVINDSFRVYDNKGESLKDYGEFLYKNKRYSQKGIFIAKHYTSQIQAVENAGYSTKEDENGNKMYADLVIKIIKENDLQLIDHKIQLQKSSE